MDAATQTVALGVSLTTNVDGQTQVVFQTHVPVDTPDGEINALIDRVFGFTERLQKKASLAILKKRESDLSKGVRRAQEDMVSLDEKHKLAREVSGADRRKVPDRVEKSQLTDRLQAQAAIDRWKEDLKDTRDQIKLIEEL